MKSKFLNKFKKWASTLGIGSVFGLVAIANNQYQNYQKANAEEYIILSQPYNVSYNDNNSEVVLTANEVENYHFNNFYNLLKDDIDNANANIHLVYNSSEIDGNLNDHDYYGFPLDGSNWLVLQNVDNNYYFKNYENGTITTYSNSITLSSNNYQALKSAVELDVQANQSSPSGSMGTQIIGAITEGLGLISDLASEFLTGFTTIFYQNGALTNFAIFSLVMLGIAITMAVIKLVLSILRSNTGV